jgi:hypothetical protein
VVATRTREGTTGGGHKKSAKKSLRDMKEGGGGRWGMRSAALFQKGLVREEENPTHAPPRRVSVES